MTKPAHGREGPWHTKASIEAIKTDTVTISVSNGPLPEMIAYVAEQLRTTWPSIMESIQHTRGHGEYWYLSDHVKLISMSENKDSIMFVYERIQREKSNRQEK